MFSHPPIGTIGLTEPDAREEFGADNVRVKQARFPSMLYAFNDADNKVRTGLELTRTFPHSHNYLPPFTHPRTPSTRSLRLLAQVKTGLKLVLAGPDDKVVGLHCIGPFSDEMLQGFAIAVRMGATRADFEASVAIHPTVSEEFVTFGGWGQTNPEEGAAAKPMLPPYLRPDTDEVATLKAEVAALKAELAALKK